MCLMCVSLMGHKYNIYTSVNKTDFPDYHVIFPYTGQLLDHITHSYFIFIFSL